MMQQVLSDFLSAPLTIRDRTVSSRIVLAPMAGLGHIALRQLIAEYGGFGLLFTGMCSAKALPHENPGVSKVFSWRQEELSYLVCQIFGSDPQSMAQASKRIENEGFWGVDLNFGCSVAAICKKGSGAALLRNPKLSVQIVQAVRDAVSIPVMVKFRTGWQDNPQFAVEMAQKFEDAGADALTFHPRVAPDRRSRPPKWEVIKEVCTAVNIPVFGNGNLFCQSDAEKMRRQTGCDGLAVGRMAVARPWLFAEWSQNQTMDKQIFYQACHRYIQILSDHFDDFFALKFFKKFLPYYCANFKFGHQILKQMMVSKSMAEGLENLNMIFENNPEIATKPNQHLFI